MTAHGKTHAAYLALKAQHPDWRDVDLAKELKVSRQRIGQLKVMENPPRNTLKRRMAFWIAAGHSDDDIATLFDTTHTYVAKIRQSLGIKYKAGRPPKTPKS